MPSKPKVWATFVLVPGLCVLSLGLCLAATRAQAQTDAERSRVPLGIGGSRGLVLFDHRVHEPLLNPDLSFPHPAKRGIACLSCHHSVETVTERRQFQKCGTCHLDDGHPENPADKEGYEVNLREAFHRNCISCHRASDIKASNERFRDAGFTKCGECHVRGANFTLTGLVEREPPPLDPAPPRPARATTIADVFKNPEDPPLGYSGPSPIKKALQTTPDSYERPDRWRIGVPYDPRFEKGSLWNPYNQSVLKGDYPLFGQHNFVNLTLGSDTLVDFRRLPVPSDVSPQRPDSAEFFGRGEQFFLRQNFVVSADYFYGDTAFKPFDFRVHAAANFNINYLRTEENGIVNIDVRRGNTRQDDFMALEDAFTEVRLGDTTQLFPFLRGRGSKGGESPYFDTTSLRAGIQPFISDFRGFIFSDINLGARLFGNFANNRYQFNLAYFNLLEKDTNSELNTRELRDQVVFVGNLFRQDTIWKGYTTQFSYHYSNDRPTLHFDVNQFLVRPAAVGFPSKHGVKSHYLGWAGEGHIGRLNISHAFYQVLGHDTKNPIAGSRVDINAQMAAVEASVDRDWVRFKGSFLWASGDKEPLDGSARGFDAIVDIPEFAGGLFSFWNEQGIRLTQTGVALINPRSLLPTLRSSKTQGQANFINPGIFIYNTGMDLELTPKLRAILNLSFMRFQHSEPLELLLFQPNVGKNVGIDYGAGVVFRPLLSENILFVAGFSSLIPGTGFKDIFSSICAGQGCGASARNLYSGFIRLKFIF